MENYGLIMPFYDESKPFVHGFECGMIWVKMEAGERIEKRIVHTANVPQLRLMEKHFGYEFIIKKIDDTYSELESVVERSIPGKSPHT